MFLLNAGIVGDRLPQKTLALTYDDGPGTTTAPSGAGPRTDDLGYFLFLNGIEATFFVIGNRAETDQGPSRSTHSLGALGRQPLV